MGGRPPSVNNVSIIIIESVGEIFHIMPRSFVVFVVELIIIKKNVRVMNR